MFSTRKLGVSLLLAFAVLASGATRLAAASRQASPPAGLLRAVRALRAQEQAVRNIRIHAACVFHGQLYDPRAKKFVWLPDAIGRDRLTATFDGSPRGSFRADVPMEWATGPYGHLGHVFVDSYIVAYNGRVGTYLQTAIASVGSKKLFPYNHGSVSGKMPIEWDTIDEASGWAYCVFGFDGDVRSAEHPRFSKYISPGQKGITVNARWTRWKGRRYLQVTRTGPPLGRDVFLLDPRKAYSIVRCEHHGWTPVRSRAGRIHLTPTARAEWWFDVGGFIEPKIGVFYPRTIHLESVDPLNNIKLMSIRVNVSKVVLNNPKVNAGTWVVKFPRGALIEDEATGRYIRIVGTPQQQLKEIEAAVKADR